MRLTTGTINNQMRLLLRKAVLSFEGLQPDHALRKFFDTTLINSNVDPKFKEMLMGHSIKLDDVYYDKKITYPATSFNWSIRKQQMH